MIPKLTKNYWSSFWVKTTTKNFKRRLSH